MPGSTFTATLQRDEAVLRFPYDDGLRRLLRAIPGRRWDPEERVWRVPLEAEQADALARLLDGLPGEPDVEERLARTIERRRRRRGRRDCLVDLARPDEHWRLSFATDGPPELLARLLDHPDAQRLEEIGRAHVPLDERSAATVRSLRESGLRLSEAAAQAIRQHARGAGRGERRARRPQRAERSDSRRLASAATGAASTGSSSSGRWAALARVLAGRAGLRAAEGPGGSVGLAAGERDAEALEELLGHLEDALVEERVTGVARARQELARQHRRRRPAAGRPVLLLLGDAATAAEGGPGASVRGSPAAPRCR